MRRTTFIENDKQHVFDIMRAAAEDAGFDVLYADRFHLEVEAIKGKRIGRKKHLSIRIIVFKNHEVELNIEVRNMGLEIKRNKRNDLIEAQIERAITKDLRKGKKKYSAA